MAKMSEGRKEARGITPPKPVTRNFNEAELQELNALSTLVAGKKFECIQIKNNTALIVRGQEVLAELESITRLLENVKNQWVSQKLAELGYEKNKQVSINPRTGEVLEIKVETK